MWRCSKCGNLVPPMREDCHVCARTRKKTEEMEKLAAFIETGRHIEQAEEWDNYD